MVLHEHPGLFRSSWLLLLAGILAGGCVGYLLHSLSAGATGRIPDGSSLLGSLGPASKPLTIVVTDSNLQAYREIFGKQVTLQSYIDRTYQNDPSVNADARVANAMAFATASNETNVSSAVVAANFRVQLPRRPTTIKHPHDVSLREFQNAEDIVLLGGPWINPWGQLFESRLKYRLIPMANIPAQPELQVVNPGPGEPSDYRPHADVNYVRIAVLPNFSHSGHVVLVGATSAAALEAGGAYLGSSEHVRDILKKMHASSPNDLPPFEMVIEVRGLHAVPEASRIIAVHPLE